MLRGLIFYFVGRVDLYSRINARITFVRTYPNEKSMTKILNFVMAIVSLTDIQFWHVSVWIVRIPILSNMLNSSIKFCTIFVLLHCQCSKLTKLGDFYIPGKEFFLFSRSSIELIKRWLKSLITGRFDNFVVSLCVFFPSSSLCVWERRIWSISVWRCDRLNQSHYIYIIKYNDNNFPDHGWITSFWDRQ